MNTKKCKHCGAAKQISEYYGELDFYYCGSTDEYQSDTCKHYEEANKENDKFIVKYPCVFTEK